MRKRYAAYAPTMAPPKTTFAIMRWMLMGIHVAFAKALQNWTIAGDVSGPTSAGGLIMYVSQEFAMNITKVPHTLSSMPNVQCPSFARPWLQRSHP